VDQRVEPLRLTGSFAVGPGFVRFAGRTRDRAGQPAYTSNSDTWPAGQPVFAVNVSRR
jgi:hypothetical protein